MNFIDNNDFAIEFQLETLENLNDFLEEYMINSGIGVENVDLNLSPNWDNDEEAMSPVDASDDVESPENINSQNNDNETPKNIQQHNNISYDVFANLEGNFRVISHPTPLQRARRNSDKNRYLQNNRQNPIILELPNLAGIKLGDKENLGLFVSLVTTIENPDHLCFLHVNELCCGIENSTRLNQGIFIPLKTKHIINERIRLKKIGIRRLLYRDYDFKLTVFDKPDSILQTINYHSQTNMGLRKCQLVRMMRDNYHLDDHHIVFRLAMVGPHFNQFSDEFCVTNRITITDPRN